MSVYDERAFPSQASEKFDTPSKGMTLLDYFAGQAMQSLVSGERKLSDNSNAGIAKAAYNMAQAMIAERNKISAFK